VQIQLVTTAALQIRTHAHTVLHARNIHSGFVLYKAQYSKAQNIYFLSVNHRVSVQGVKSLGGHFACLCRGFEFYEVKKKNCYYFSKRIWKYFYTFNHFYIEKSSKKSNKIAQIYYYDPQSAGINLE